MSEESLSLAVQVELLQASLIRAQEADLGGKSAERTLIWASGGVGPPEALSKSRKGDRRPAMDSVEGSRGERPSVVSKSMTCRRSVASVGSTGGVEAGPVVIGE